ncbi:AsmA family protein [Photobacterium japonica]|uniref:AsmA family protein n=1 Tax=Photobacterium japonica TaxID=2910235 RepID=UPI003D0BBA6B
MRLFGKLTATIVILLLLTGTVGLTLLHTRFATPLVLWTVNLFSPYPVSAAHIDYHIRQPLTLIIDQPQLQFDDTQTISAKRLSLWLSPYTFVPNKEWHWQLDTLLIEHPSLPVDAATLHALFDAGNTHRLRLPTISAQRLAISDFTGKWNKVQFTNSQLEWDNWSTQPDAASPFWQHFTGNVRVAANAIQWQNLTLNNVLIDGEHHAGLWTLYGLSANGQHASFNGQAVYDATRHHLTVPQFTVSDGQWQSTDPLSALQPYLDRLVASPLTVTLKRVDILNSSMESPSLTLNHASLSLENWHWPRGVYDQPDALFSFSANSGRWQETDFSEPLLDLAFSPQAITLQGGSIHLLDGYLQAEGTAHPDRLALTHLTINGVKGFLPPSASTPLTHAWATLHNSEIGRALTTVTLEQLDINHTHLTASDPAWPWQISGLQIDGKQLTLMQQGHPGLWHGSLTSSAHFASLNAVDVHEPWVEFTADQGVWQLRQAIIPFKDGLLAANGQWARNQEGQPWRMQLSGDSLPTQLLTQWLAIPLPIAGKMDIEGEAKGLGESRTSLAYSLAGSLSATFRDTAFTVTPDSLWQHWAQDNAAATPAITTATEAHQTVALSPLRIDSERGQIVIAPLTLHSHALQATINGRWDLTDPKAQTLNIEAQQGCQQLQRHWQADHASLSVSTSSASTCDGNNI